MSQWVELVTSPTSFHSPSEDFHSVLVVYPKYCLVVRVIFRKLGWETDFGLFWAYHLTEDHRCSCHANWPMTGTYPSPYLFFSPQPAPLSALPIALLSSISIWYFSQHFILVFHPMIHKSGVSVLLFNISFSLEYQFWFVIATCDAMWMVHGKSRQKRFSGQFFFQFPSGV